MLLYPWSKLRLVQTVNLVYIHTKGGFHFSLEVLFYFSGRREHTFDFNFEVGNR